MALLWTIERKDFNDFFSIPLLNNPIVPYFRNVF